MTDAPRSTPWTEWLPYIGLLIGLVSTFFNPMTLVSIVAFVISGFALVQSLRGPKGARSLNIIVSSAGLAVSIVATIVPLFLMG
jgi:hypothetical protein